MIPRTHVAGGGNSPHPLQHGRPFALQPPVLGPRHQFPFGSPAFPFLFYEATTDTTECLLGVHTAWAVWRCSLDGYHRRRLQPVLLHHGNKRSPRFVQRGTQHSLYARYLIIYSNFCTKFPPTPKHKQHVLLSNARAEGPSCC